MARTRNTRLLGAGRELVDKAKAWVQLHQAECGCSLAQPCSTVNALALGVGTVIDTTPGLALVTRAAPGGR